MKKRWQNIDDYIQAYPKDVQVLLEQMRLTIRRTAPSAEETISYSMPAFKQKGVLVWFAAFKNHIGFYPGASGVAHFKKDLSRFKNAKGSVQFPHDKPLPLALISRIVRFRVLEQKRQQSKK